ncbi:hypothetical protein D0T84_03805 [Dysgonomonas sp. 521]|uniref:hypothetical protein n=1 Tax=Dysgonomonas sp. 521 TaxID=2302932 RepID=UPI0013D10391|nr:hypothetical protein [Dysgonomonas sp. 521]NDV94043.1 hypothetical protein [Dysgonomonas sp. 521]
MKKLLLLLLVIPFIFGSCSSDDDDNNSLNGTTWESYEDEGDGYIYKSTLTFYESTYSGYGYEEYNGKKYEFQGTGTYKYNHPNVTFTEDGETYTAKISGNKMIVGEEDIIYTKK